MPKYDYDVVAIGGGAAGLTASTACAGAGKRALLIEKEEKLGGDCLHYGCVPSKSLIKSAYARNVMNHAKDYGLPDLQLPEVKFKDVSSRIKGIIDHIQKHDEPEYIKEKFNVDTKFGEPTFIDPHTIELNGEKITANYFFITTGSLPAVPPIEGINDVPYITNVEIFTIEELPKDMIVLGAGPIGMEMAQSFARLGTKVTVVEFAPHVLPREDEDVSEYIEEVMIKEGIELYLSTKGKQVSYEDGRFSLVVDNNGRKQKLDAEQLLVATGRAPNVEGLNLDKVGVQYDQKGIKVDRTLRTSIKNIFACGDVNGSFPFTHVASYEAVTAMFNSVILPFPLMKTDYTNVPWCTYTDPEVASVGYNESRATEAGIKFTVHKENIIDNHRAIAESETGGFLKLIINNKGVVIGCQIVGFHAGDLIHEWVAAISGKISLNTISNAIHAYPTLAEINKTASLNYFLKAPTFTKLRMLLNWRW